MNTHHFSRRTFLRGVGVTIALPWMESLAVLGRPGPRRDRRQPGAGAVGSHVFGQRLPQPRVVGQRRPARKCSSAKCWRRWPISAKNCSSSEGF